MNKGSYPVVDKRGKFAGRQVYVEGRGWVYRPLPKATPWIALNPEEAA